MARPGTHLTPQERQRLREAIASGQIDGKPATMSAIARHTGHHRNTVAETRRELLQAGLTALRGQKAPDPPKPLEVHDAAFWREKAKKLDKQRGELQRVVEELGGVRGIPIQFPDWVAPPRQSKRGRAVIGGLVSDIHDGERITPGEILGVNEYNPDICERRLVRYFEAVCAVGPRWAEDSDIEGFFLALAGDLISGDIHEELRMTNALTSQEAVQHVLGILIRGVDRLLETFGFVHVVGVPGNHGRTTPKPTAKLYSRLSYDTLIVSLLARHFKDDPRVTVQCSAAKDQITPIFGRTILTTHFDKIGTRGGRGFAGPMLPIVRGAKMVIEQQGSVDRYPDLILGGHYHSTGNPYLGRVPILANGSVIGVNEFADDLRVAVEPPQQWAFCLHSRWWLLERQPIILTDLETPPKPVVRIRPEMARV